MHWRMQSSPPSTYMYYNMSHISPKSAVAHPFNNSFAPSFAHCNLIHRKKNLLHEKLCISVDDNNPAQHVCGKTHSSPPHIPTMTLQAIKKLRLPKLLHHLDPLEKKKVLHGQVTWYKHPQPYALLCDSWEPREKNDCFFFATRFIPHLWDARPTINCIESAQILGKRKFTP